MSVCLEVFGSPAEDTVLVGLVVLAGFLVGHFAQSENLDIGELYLPKSLRSDFVVGKYVSCGIFHLEGLGSFVDQIR